MKQNYFLSWLITSIVLGLSLTTASAQALTVSTLDCSGIDTTDGNVEDWSGIPHLINTEDSVTGTTYYLNSDTDDWVTEEPSDWRYSANLDQQANIQEMKMCNTDIMQLMLRTEEPMMFFYDKEQDSFIDFWNTYENSDGDFVNFTLPADYPYWMVWKMQAADGTGTIIYLAADLTMDQGRELNGDSDTEDPIPTLYLFQESDDVAYADASFDPNVDVELTTIALSDDGEGDIDCSGDNLDPACEPEPVQRKYYAFEVSQNISELFAYADFAYGDTINITATMYNSGDFSTASGRSVMTVLDQTDTKQYTFSKRAVTGLHPLKNSTKTTAVTLTWKAINQADKYQIKLINPNNDKVIRLIKGISDSSYKITGLDAGTTYRAIVRAVTRTGSKATLSAWSSGYKWTTDSE